MAIISFDSEEIIEYVPSYAGNRDSEDPCVVRLKFVPYAKVQKYAKMISVQGSGKSARKQMEISQSIQKKQFMDSVESVSGYRIGSTDITDPGEFFESADTEIIIELIQAMENSQKLDEGQLKNSVGDSVTNTEQEMEAPSTVASVQRINE
jgi:hypothetical protein